MAEAIRLQVNSSTAQVAPGGHLQLRLTITNISNVIDRFVIALSGMPSSWYTLDRSVVPLFPATSEELGLAIHPPADRTATAGIHTLVLTVTSEDNPLHTASTSVAVTVARIGGLEIDLAPTAARGRRATFRLTFHNGTNAEVVLSLQTRDAEELLYIRQDPEEPFSIAPGGQTTVQVQVRPERRRLVGPPHQYDIEFRGLPEGASTIGPAASHLVRQGRFTYVPLLRAPALPSWLRRLPLLAVLLAFLLALLGLLLFLLVPRFVAPNAGATSNPTATVTARPTDAPSTATAPPTATASTSETLVATPVPPTSTNTPDSTSTAEPAQTVASTSTPSPTSTRPPSATATVQVTARRSPVPTVRPIVRATHTTPRTVVGVGQGVARPSPSAMSTRPMSTATPMPSAGATSRPSATATTIPPTKTRAVSASATRIPPTRTATARATRVPPTHTAAASPTLAPLTHTAIPTSSATRVPPTPTATASATKVRSNSLATATVSATPGRPTRTATARPTSTATARPIHTATASATRIPPTRTATATTGTTKVPPTSTATASPTRVPPANTATAMASATGVPPTHTATATPVPPTSTATASASATPVPPTSTFTPTFTATPSATRAPTDTSTATPAATSTARPVASVTPVAIHFPYHCPAGDCGFSRTTPYGPTPVTITNGGPGALTINAVTLDGPDAQSFSAKGCQGATLSPGNSCQIAVSFDTKTQSRGDGKGNYAASLTITDDAGNSPQTVQLTAFYPPPAVALSPSTLTFPPDTVTVSNTSSGADLTVTKVAITGTSAADFTVASNTCDTSIHAGSSCTIQVGFSFRGNAPACSASSGSAYCAQLIISDNADQGQQQVDLRASFVIG